MSSNQPSKAIVRRRKEEVATITPSGGTIRRIEPAQHRDVISVARAMHKDKFAKGVQEIFEPEKEAALLAIETGNYVSWRCADFKHDCQRLGPKARCFCAHSLDEHRSWDRKSVSVACNNCVCKSFKFVPSRPEEVGEFWLKKRPGYDPTTWRAKCKCKHTHEDHVPDKPPHRCRSKGCNCMNFAGAFMCAACDRRWELHETFFETEQDRKEQGLPYGQDYLPFAEAPTLSRIVMVGHDTGEDTLDACVASPAVTYGVAHRPAIGPGSSNTTNPDDRVIVRKH